jgi:hypothetical protein
VIGDGYDKLVAHREGASWRAFDRRYTVISLTAEATVILPRFPHQS